MSHRFLQTGSGRTVPLQRPASFHHQQAYTRTVQLHPFLRDVLMEQVQGGTDYHRICLRHQWAALPVTRVEDCPDCPECVAELEAFDGRERYRQLQRVSLVNVF